MIHSSGHLLIQCAAAGFVVWTAQTASAAIWSPAPQRAAFGDAVAGTLPVSLPATGVIEVDAATPGAILRIDGRPMGPAIGFLGTLPAGDHEIEISAPGYKAIRQTVRVAGGGTVRLRPQLVRLPQAPLAASATGPSQSDIAGQLLPPALRTTRGLPTPGAGPHRASGAPATVRSDFPRPLPKPSAPSAASAAAAAGTPAPISGGRVADTDENPPATPARAAPPPLGILSFRTVQAALDDLVPGSVAFNAPHRMERDKSRVIEARLAVDIPPEVLIEQLTEAGRKVSRSLKVGDRMIATLSGGDAFEVSPSGPQQQFISRQQMTTWMWQVTPKKGGTQYLMLSFDAVLSIDGKEGTRKIRTLKEEIEVQVAWADRLKDWLEWLKGMVENLAWLWITILVPAGLWIWRRLGKRLRPAAPRKLRRARHRRLGRDRAAPAAALSPNGPVEGSPPEAAYAAVGTPVDGAVPADAASAAPPAERPPECANARRPSRSAASAAA